MVAFRIICYLLHWFRVAETGYRDIQLRKYGRERSPEQYTARYRKNSLFNCERDIKVRGSSIDSTDPKTRQFTALSSLKESCSSNRRYSSNNFELEKKSNFEEESEVLELVLRFLGPWGKTFYQTILMMLMFVGLIAYTQVFVNTFVSQIYPGVSTIIPSLFFGVIAVPLSCIDLAEQISVQVIMSILRFLSLATLLFGTIAAMVIDPHPAIDPNTSIGYYKFSGFGLMFTTAIFSQLFQHSVPGLIRPLSQADKQHVSNIFGWALVTTGSIYILIGTICTLYFGKSINQAINLNFVNYYWGLPQPNEGDSLQYFAFFLVIKSLSMLIVLFPALDTLSVFPLIANTLGNNFHAAFPKGYKTTVKFLQYLPHSLVDYLLRSVSNSSISTAIAYSTSNSQLTRLLTLKLWRLCAAFPPVIISIYVTNLSLTLQFAGVCGVLVALVVPALLQYYSLQEVPDIPSMNNRENNPNAVYFELNPYSGYFSNRSFVYFVLLVAFVALIICVLQIATLVLR